jgi:hypothetical protein
VVSDHHTDNDISSVVSQEGLKESSIQERQERGDWFMDLVMLVP